MTYRFCAEIIWGQGKEAAKNMRTWSKKQQPKGDSNGPYA